MRAETGKKKLETFMAELGKRVRGDGRIYLAGGATALLYGSFGGIERSTRHQRGTRERGPVHSTSARLARAQFVYRASW